MTGNRFARGVAATALALSFVCASPASSAPIVTPALGGAPWTAAGVATLHADLDATLDRSRALASAHVGVVAIDTATGAVLYDRHGEEAFQPASTLKLVVGSAALDLLGPTFAPTTRTSLSEGDIIVEVAGDPFFSEKDVDAIAAGVRRLGRSAVNDVVIRDSGDESPHPDGWTYDDFAEDYAAPISYATLEENVVHVVVRPGLVAGAPVVVATSPDPSLVAADESACSADGAFVVDRATTSAEPHENSLDADALPDGCRALTGKLGVGEPPTAVDVAVPSPAPFLARAVVRALRAAGVAVTGNGRVEKGDTLRAIAYVRARLPVVAHTGLALSDVMPRFWIPSDNFVGELLLLDLAGSGRPDSPRSLGLDAERAWLRSIGVDPATTTLADGSGLSQYDRITPYDLVTILQHDWNGPNRRVVLDSLPIGGARGTIEGIAGTPAAGRVFAKTGSMMHVRGLAGYLATQRHGAVTFAFEVDDWIGAYADLAAVRAAVLARIVRD